MSGFTHYKVDNAIQRPIMSTTNMDIDNTGQFLNKIKKDLRINITKLTSDDIEFDLIGVDAAIANALRRILLSEVPTIAVETVWISVNTSIIQDEVLAHRIGLIPIKADPRKLEFPVKDEELSETDCIVFHFDVSCPPPPANLTPEQRQAYKFNALSGEMKWNAVGNQDEVFPEGVAPVHDDIVLAVLGAGQRIEFEAHCHKGIGKDHVKFSPVCTAAYRLLPEITFPDPIINEQAEELQAMCPMGVFDIEDIGGVPTAVTARPRDCTMCRECIRREGWSERVELKRVANHFIFTVESSGSMPPEEIVRESISVLKDKSLKFQNLIVEYENDV